jgi:hypothetical protein
MRSGVGRRLEREGAGSGEALMRASVAPPLHALALVVQSKGRQEEGEWGGVRGGGG